MSELPSIPEETIYKRLSANLSTKYAEVAYQIAHLELLAESLRNQRDAALKEAETLKNENNSLHEKCNVLTSELNEERGIETETAYSFRDPDNSTP